MDNKMYVAFFNLFAAFGTTLDKHQFLQMTDAFYHSMKSFQPTWRNITRRAQGL